MSLVIPTASPFLPGRHGLVGQVAWVVGGSLVLAASAKLQVPFWPVPVTMQSLAVVMIGLLYGSRLGVLTVGLYLLEGLAGLPVFAGAAAGPAYMAGPTGGYLAGFLASAAVVGAAAERGWCQGWWRTALVLALGHAVLLAPGVAWLALSVGWGKAVAAGLLPFLAGTAAKTALGTAMAAAARPR